MTVDDLRVPSFGRGWSTEAVAWSGSGGRLTLRRSDGLPVAIEIRRCARGRLRHAYPVAARDVEVRVANTVSEQVLSEVLAVVVDSVRQADPRCRKVVYAVGRGGREDEMPCSAAKRAGFRHAVDIDLADEELSLMVAEPDWVTAVDMDLARVPGS